jgi:hypothetical protein
VRVRFEADLDITGANGRIAVTNDPSGALVVTTDELRPLVGALRDGGLLPSGTLRTVSDLLADTGATVRVRTPTSGLLTLGSGASPTVLTRAAGLHHVRIESVRGLLVALRPPLRTLLPAVGLAVAALVAVRRRKA